MQALGAGEVNGTWASFEIPGTATLNQGGNAAVDSLSCGSPGTCSAVGTYALAGGQNQAFVVSQANGTWAAAQEVRGISALNAGGYAELFSVSCAPSTSACSAGGYYTDGSGHRQAFLVTRS